MTRRGAHDPEPAPGPPSNPAALSGPVRPWRVLGWVLLFVAAAVAVDLLSPHAGFVDGVALVFFTPVVPVGMRQAVRLLRGSVHHTFIAAPPLGWSDAGVHRWRAGTPSGCFGMLGLYVMFCVLILSGDPEGVPGALGFAGVGLAFVGALLAVTAGLFMRPRFLVPATMRPGRPE